MKKYLKSHQLEIILVLVQLVVVVGREHEVLNHNLDHNLGHNLD
jgi:hypothetical protein